MIDRHANYTYNIITKELKEDLKDEPTIPDEPGKDESGCKKDLSTVLVSLISLSSLLILIKKREK